MNTPQNAPLVSVIIPVYNLSAYLATCLDSVMRQTFADFEAIVVNDGSTDDSLEILRFYEARDARFRVIDTPNQGVAKARETGLRSVRGDYICFLDGDDWWEPDMLEQMTRAIAENDGYDIVCCNHRRVCKTYQTVVKERHCSDMKGLQFLEATLCHAIWVTVWGKLYRSALFNDGIHHYPLRLGQDAMLNIQIGCHRPRVHFMDYVGYNYLQRTTSSNHQGFDFDYCQLFCSTVECELSRRSAQLDGKAEFLGLLNKIRWYLVYIRKSSSVWSGNTLFAERIRRLLKQHKEQIKPLHQIPRSMRYLLFMDQYRALRPAVILQSTFMRWVYSFKRRFIVNS